MTYDLEAIIYFDLFLSPTSPTGKYSRSLSGGFHSLKKLVSMYTPLRGNLSVCRKH